MIAACIGASVKGIHAQREFCYQAGRGNWVYFYLSRRERCMGMGMVVLLLPATRPNKMVRSEGGLCDVSED